MVRRLDSASVRDMSTIVLEVQGGTHNESTGALDEIIAVGTKNIFSADTEYPWSSTVSVGTKGLIITPFDPSADRQYSYDIYVELVTSKKWRSLGGSSRVIQEVRMTFRVKKYQPLSVIKFTMGDYTPR